MPMKTKFCRSFLSKIMSQIKVSRDGRVQTMNCCSWPRHCFIIADFSENTYLNLVRNYTIADVLWWIAADISANNNVNIPLLILYIRWGQFLRQKEVSDSTWTTCNWTTIEVTNLQPKRNCILSILIQINKNMLSSNLHVVLNVSDRVVLNTIVQILAQLKWQTASTCSECKRKLVLYPVKICSLYIKQCLQLLLWRMFNKTCQ